MFAVAFWGGVSGGVITKFELGMAQEALVFVEGVFLAPEAILFFKFRVAQPAAILIAVVPLAPKATFFALGGIANEAALFCPLMGMSDSRKDFAFVVCVTVFR
jgi:hypothetical protein